MPFPSPMRESEVAQSRPTQRPHGLQLTSILGIPWQPSSQDSTLPLPRAQGQSLVGELRPHKLHSAAKSKHGQTLVRPVSSICPGLYTTVYGQNTFTDLISLSVTFIWF